MIIEHSTVFVVVGNTTTYGVYSQIGFAQARIKELYSNGYYGYYGSLEISEDTFND